MPMPPSPPSPQPLRPPGQEPEDTPPSATASEPAPASPRVRQHRGLARLLLLVLAWLSLGMGVIGIFVPGLPTTVFVLIAAWAAARSSPRLHQWLYTHRLFGPMLRNWEAGGFVSRPAKRAAALTMLACAALMLVLDVVWWATALACGCMLCVGIWLWLRPEPPPGDSR